MFSKKNKKLSSANIARVGAMPSVIAHDLKIAGDLICGGVVEIEGEIEGNVTCDNVTIRRNGFVRGDIIADQICIEGRVSGLVKGKGVTISDTGRITGIIIYDVLSVKDGAQIEGQCKRDESNISEQLRIDAIEEMSENDNIIELEETT